MELRSSGAARGGRVDTEVANGGKGVVSGGSCQLGRRVARDRIGGEQLSTYVSHRKTDGSPDRRGSEGLGASAVSRETLTACLLWRVGVG